MYTQSRLSFYSLPEQDMSELNEDCTEANEPPRKRLQTDQIEKLFNRMVLDEPEELEKSPPAEIPEFLNPSIDNQTKSSDSDPELERL
jgi:hypothetical protein